MDTLRPLLLVFLGRRTVLSGSAGMVTPAGQVSGGLSLRAAPPHARPRTARDTTKVGSHGRQTGSWLRHLS